MLTREEFTAKVKEIAESLGYSLEIDDDRSYDTHYAYLTSGEQKVTLINGEYGHADRMVITSSYPRAKDNQYPHGAKEINITVADTKTPFQILQDMLRRFFPKYEEQLGKVIQQNLDRNAYIDQQFDMMVVMGVVSETEVRWKDQGRSGEGIIYPKDIGVYSIESYSDRVKIVLEAMEVAEALALIAFLKERRAAELEPGAQLMLV